MKYDKTVRAIFVVGIILRVFLYWARPLWYDENFTLILARLPWDQMWAANLADVHPPLWYVLTWMIGRLPALPAWFIRFPSVLLSIAALWLFWKILANTYPTVRTVAFTLMAISPIQVYYAQEGRMYAMLTFLVLAAWYYIMQRKWVMLALSLTALLYTQNVGALYMACLGLAGILLYYGHPTLYWRWDLNPKSVWPRCLLPMAGAFLFAVLAWLPWVPSLLTQMDLISGRFWVPPVTVGGALYHYAQMFWLAYGSARLEIACDTVFFTWLFLALWRVFRTRPVFYAAVLVLAFGPFVLEILISLLNTPILLHRTLIGSTPFLYILLAVPVAEILQHKKISMVALAIFIPLIISWYALRYEEITHPDEYATRTVLNEIESHWHDGDIVYNVSDNLVIDNVPYADESAGHQYKMPLCDTVIGGLTDQTVGAMGIQLMRLEQIPWERAWIITHNTPLNPLCEQDYINPYISGLEPIICLGDQLIESCLYLVDHR